MSSIALIIPQLRILFTTLTDALLEADLRSNRAHRLVRDIARVARMIMSGEVWLYQMRVKAAMLSDPARRAQVISALGGYAGLMRWNARYLAGTPEAVDVAETGHKTSRPIPKTPNPSTCQFRLPPLPRATSKRHFREPRDKPYTFKNPFKAPIIVTVVELIGRSELSETARETGANTDNARSAPLNMPPENPAPKNTTPKHTPPTPLPPSVPP